MRDTSKENTSNEKGYTIETGVWACDVQGSSSLKDEAKAIIEQTIDNIINDLQSQQQFELIAKQFRGDGYFLTFDAKNVEKTIIEFADSFCRLYNKQIESGELNENIPIRTYIDHIKVFVDSSNANETKVVGKSVDAFCRRVDNKYKDRIETRKQDSAILIASDNVYKRFNEDVKTNNRWQEIEYENEPFYILHYHPRNFIFRFLGTDKDDCLKLERSMKDVAKSLSFNIFDSGEVGISFAANIDDTTIDKKEIKKILSSLETAFYKSGIKFTKRQGSEVIMAIVDLKYCDEPIDDEKITPLFSKLDDGKESSKYRRYLVWSDSAMEEYVRLSDDKSITSEYTKYTLTGSNRLYYKTIGGKKRGSSGRKDKDIIYIPDLEDCIYLHSFDYHAIQLIKKTLGTQTEEFADKYIKDYLRKQLEIGLVLHDSVIFHSAEVARSKVVYDILIEYEKLFAAGRIKLLFSSRVTDISQDFYEYFKNKIGEYSQSRYGEEEASSLRMALEDTEHMEKVIRLLCKSPEMIKRRGDGTYELEEFIRNDLYYHTSGIIRDKNEFGRMEELLVSNYTIWQLLNARYVEDDSVKSILQSTVIDDINQTIDRLVNGTISAGILIGVFEEKISESIRENFPGWYLALLHRANYLYARINSDKLPYMEFLPFVWKNSLVNYNSFIKDFPIGRGPDLAIGCNRLTAIRRDQSELKKFRLQYAYALMLKSEIPINALESRTYKERVQEAKDKLQSILKGNTNVYKSKQSK